MILTCPQCETRYRLTAERLAPEGHRVKCTNCGEIWHQMPDPDELDFVEMEDLPEPETHEEEPVTFRDHVDLEFRDIPDSVKPIREGHVVLPKAPEIKKSRFDNRISGYAAALLVFILVFEALVFWKNDIVAGWPAATLFYETMGINVPAPGEGLRFEDITARASPSEDGNGEFIEIAGRIVNSMGEDRPLLPVHAHLRDTEGKSLDEWAIEIPEQLVPAQSAVSFAVARQTKRKPEDVRLVFVFKTDEEDAGNTQAHLPDDRTLQHASE